MVRIRLARRGRKKLAIYDIVVADARAPRDGRFIEKLGQYNPNTNPASITLNEERALKWLLEGAQPTDTARSILSQKGVLYRKHLQVGVRKGAITQEEADARYEAWWAQKQAKIASKIDTLAAKKEAEFKARIEAEAKVKEARAEALRKKEEAAAQQVANATTETTTEQQGQGN
ncbi:MAG: 30S ribosomal protein S16 [Microscillaceae bacterium]|nr:30S ribosomal protein S16 [Microscillaceae bacterium]MDW8460435.1 30S ribosomal protein S16 [Cytophagales bacterium]